ncbi:bifunctional hydroxymethylpyrimidine kinase/phosphomethylpyrimidine kinase [Klebsiella sp. RHBSTW-00484]|uniref:PfkB family carbohydrate kinase n=1 Tax=unclassified Klebsiella TaxID=2608929 RepID=UPI0015E4D2F9|nr:MULTISPECIES: PfkB family carbohydrate kinase [unclassified Klebsiella]MBA7847117.1 bifunctional hydroxymethylpyrimidine kinase/phosphomethylpyrimidine kinase [Klebsiella sp. RHBSTW-00465]QLO36981.1 bifunctional hydroxymethylpyrimidine kinase/phosphomethylpyrimidine kinase [Klebsiella sp. RHBSTW-00484]QLT76499.1 bifunctional hydroxymethylpyrimidine kinase/phosphomethylpyrimidine kinase [Klebsiella sp. RHBSTW-00464]
MKKQRHHIIMKFISIEGFVRVSALADYLNVTKETVRSDLNELCKKGFVNRCHGGAYIDINTLDCVTRNEIIHVLESGDSYGVVKRGPPVMKNNVCVLGSFNVDIISYLPRLPNAGESLLSDKLIFSAGGKGCNQALAASYADANVSFITKIGSDHFSEYASSFINASLIKKPVIYKSGDVQTGTATIYVDETTGENMIAIFPGANMTITADEVLLQKNAIIDSNIVLLQLETNPDALTNTIHIAHDANVPVIINPAPYNPCINQFLDGLDYLTPNETEAGLLTGIAVTDSASAMDAAQEIHRRGVKNVVITLGKKGSMAFDGRRFIFSPAFPAVVRNTAGAGDAFNGALAAELARGRSLENALIYASAFASLAVETPNASDMPDNQAVLHRINTTQYHQTFSEKKK